VRNGKPLQPSDIPLQLPQLFAIGRVLVSIDHVRRPILARPQGLCQETLGCLGVAAVGQQEVDGFVRVCQRLETATSILRTRISRGHVPGNRCKNRLGTARDTG
jgi:hypothetical protein